MLHCNIIYNVTNHTMLQRLADSVMGLIEDFRIRYSRMSIQVRKDRINDDETC